MEVTLMLALAALLIGISKGGLGGPVPGSMAAPLLTLVMPAADAVGIVLPMLLFADMLALRMYWRCWSVRYLRLMLPAAVLGIIMGTMVLLAIPDTSLRRVLGAFTLIMIAYKLTGDRVHHLRYQSRPWHGALAGWGSAFGAALANSGAAPYTALHAAAIRYATARLHRYSDAFLFSAKRAENPRLSRWWCAKD